MRPRFRHLFVLLTVIPVAVVTLLGGCSKREEERSGLSQGSLYDEALLTEAPADTVAFWVVDGTSPAYEGFRQSPWANSTGIPLKGIVPEGGAQGELTKNIKAAFERAKLFGKNAPNMVKRGAVFISKAPGAPKSNTPSTTPPAISLPLVASTVIVAQDGIDPRVNLAALVSELSREPLSAAFEVAQVDLSGAKGARITPRSDATEQDPMLAMIAALAPNGVIVGANEHRFVGAASEEEARALLAGKPRAGIQSLRASPDFARTTKTLKMNAATFLVGYADAKSTVAIFQAMLPEAQAALPNEIPLDAAAFTGSFDRSFLSGVNMAFTPRNDNQRAVLARLNGSDATDPARNLPRDAVAALTVDSRLFNEIRVGALSELPPEELAGQEDFVRLFEGVQGAGLAIRGASGASPFPEITLALDHKSPADVEGQAKSMINDAVNTGQAPLTPLQEKEVDGVRFTYAQSMIGIGAFMSATDSTFVMGTSESAVKDAITAAKGKGGFLDSLSPAGKTLFSAGAPLLSLHIDFVRLASLLQNVEGSLAMFTGGTQMFPPETLAEIRAMGSFTLAATMQENLLRLRTLYEPPVDGSTEHGA